MSVKQLIVLLCGCCFLASGCRTENVQQSGTTTTQQSSSAQTSAVANSNSTATTPNVVVNQNLNQNVTSQSSGTAATQRGQKLDPCSLITPSEITSVQGEEVKETKAAPGNSSRLAVAQCFYQTKTPSKSVSLEVTQRLSGQPGALSPREIWEERFERAARDRERERESKRGADKREAGKREARRESEEEEEEGPPARRITGVGEEAFWAGNARIGALYVLKGDSIIRISVGGIADQNQRLEKTKALAQLALKRLKD